MNASERPLRIAIIHAADFGGGAERSTLSLHRALLEWGHDSRLYVGYRHLNEPFVEEIERVRTVPGLLRFTRWLERTFGLQPLYSPGFRRLARILDPRTDLVHMQSLWGSSGYADVGGVRHFSRRFPTILTLRDQWLLTGHCAYPRNCDRWQRGCGRCPDLALWPAIRRDGTRLTCSMRRSALRRANVRISTISEWLRGEARKCPILKGKKISVVYNGIDEMVFKPGPKRAARSALGLPQGAFVAMIVGQSIEGVHRGVAQHGARALEAIGDARVLPLLVGRSAQAVAETMSIPAVVVPFRKTPEEMAQCYQAADVTLVCSENEAFGRIPAESQACGTPVVSFDTDALPEVVRHGVGGLVVPKCDTQAMKEAIEWLLARPLELKRMSQAGVDWARRQFSNLKIAQDYLALYREVIHERLSQ